MTTNDSEQWTSFEGFRIIEASLSDEDLSAAGATDLARIARIFSAPKRLLLLNTLITSTDPLGREQLARELAMPQSEVDRLTRDLWHAGAIERNRSGARARYRVHAELLPSLRRLFGTADGDW